jgi:hypothetical protein
MVPAVKNMADDGYEQSTESLFDALPQGCFCLQQHPFELESGIDRGTAFG